MKIKTPKGKALGIFLIMSGIGLIISSLLFRAVGMPDLILGFYIGPVIFVSGGIVLILNKD